jgi:hypothetical protein
MQQAEVLITSSVIHRIPLLAQRSLGAGERNIPNMWHGASNVVRIPAAHSG